VSAASDLLSNYQHVIESLTLTTGSKGIFDVTVDDELIYSKHEAGRHAEPGEVLDIFAGRFARGVARYPKD
jgi:predicted Rdx family selenoprotein